MLVLTRRIGEKIIAWDEHGSPVVFSVLGIKGNQVRVGVSASRRVNIDRKEVYDRKQNELNDKNTPLCTCAASEIRKGRCVGCGGRE